ncbi:SRPBCC domain-containing protein [Mucilaginibacter sp. UR6-1]|uniref:SRPBCC domain-containing protein n=1 Tax=Mucilaginibacter sp. UR6-1 TaxID=1435643 RepID=UPI001E554FBB|nr:SRPBCC domain-containing protein [Mucilaginibacter sp. UR6-1]MCC8410134.1 SRPBCC domain-containing protein [Mucilaginibacter sp. UR6-1]
MMSTADFEIKTNIQISKPAAEVFEAIVDPAKMSNYFIARGSGCLEAGRQVMWSFPEFEGEFPVEVKKVKENELVTLTWDVEGTPFLVEMILTPRGEYATKLTVTEKSTAAGQPSIQWLKNNTEGWANFSACLKAYVEYGINLRKGAFDFMKDNI